MPPRPLDMRRARGGQQQSTWAQASGTQGILFAQAVRHLPGVPQVHGDLGP